MTAYVTETKYTGFVSPTVLTYTDSEPENIYLADQIGIIYQIKKSTYIRSGNTKVFLDIRDKMVKLNKDYDERGLLGLGFSPWYKDDHRLFIFYSAPVSRSKNDENYENRISEITMKSNGNFDEVILLRIPKNLPYHNSGCLLFGPDNLLYVTVGDAGPQKDPENHAQNLSLLYGKMLRLDISEPGKYTIPGDNPFPSKDHPEALPEIYAYGLRNPWGIAFDDLGRLFLSDCGFETVEEIDIIHKGGNYGWNIKEGNMFSEWATAKDRKRTDLIDPIFTYTHAECGKRAKSSKMCCTVGVIPIMDPVTKARQCVTVDISGEVRIIEEMKNGKWKQLLSFTISEFIQALGSDAQGHVYLLTKEKLGVGNSTGEIDQLLRNY